MKPMKKRTDPYDSLEFQPARPFFQGLHETELDHLGRFRLPADYISALEDSGIHKVVLRYSAHFRSLRISPSNGFIIHKSSINNWQCPNAASKATIIVEDAEAGWDEDGNVAIPSSILAMIGFSPGDMLMLHGDGARLDLWRHDEWEADREEQRTQQEMYAEGNRRMFDEMVAIIKKKEKSPYAKLRKLYGYLCGLILLMGIAVAIGALYITAQEEALPSKLMIWGSIAILFGVPSIAHWFSITWIDLKSPSPPVLGFADSGAASLRKGPYLACFGFIASGAACWIVAEVPQLRSAIEALPLGWLYLPAILALAVILPFVIWLAMSILAWRARKDPFGP